jgi:hypothetical protein
VAPPYDPPPLPAALPGVPFDISWAPIEPRALPMVDDAGSGLGFWDVGWLRSVAWRGGALVSYATNAEEGPWRGPSVWRSADLVEWHRVLHPAPEGQSIAVRELIVGGPGVIAGGYENMDTPLLWVSADGEAWESILSRPMGVRFFWARPGIIVGFGSETWLSLDGRAWQHAGAAPFVGADRFAWDAVSVTDGDSAVVFTRQDYAGPTIVYRLTPDGRWQQLARLAGTVSRAIRGPDGIVALGSTEEGASLAWWSPDGVDWQSSSGPREPSNLVLTRSGYVATSQRIYYEGCDGFDPAAQIPQTWTSADGLEWRLMEEDIRLDHMELPLLFVEGDRVITMGLRWEGDWAGDNVPRSTRVAFEATLPAPMPSHTPLPVGGGCGGD